MSNTHRGKVLEQVVRTCDESLQDIAKRAGMSKQTLYNWFENANLDWSKILKIYQIIGRDIHYDFPDAPYVKVFQEPSEEYGKMRLEECQQKLIQMQEKYMELLEKYQKVVEEKQ